MATIPATAARLKLSFSTWACPEWTAAAILDAMQSFGYDGVELRIGKGHLHGVDLDSTAEDLAEVRKQFDEANLAISCLATSFAFSSPDLVERKRAIEGAKRAMQVADELGTPYVRVFGGDFPAGLEGVGVVDYVAESLAEVAEHAETEKLRSTLLLETHGSFSHSKYVTEVMTQVYSDKLGVLWDVLHPLRVLEAVEHTYDALGAYVRQVHVHDCAFNEDRTRLAPCEPGTGFVPMPRIVDLLRSGGFRGYLSLEVLQRGGDPDVVLPQYAKYLKKLLGAPAAEET
jgi:sugar phosphate isomerase/epimerase